MFIQGQIEKLGRRIRSIEQNPRSEHLRSNKLRYEVELEHLLSVTDAWREGRPIAMLEGAEQLAHPLGFVHSGYITWGDRVTDPQRYLDIAIGRGFPEHACDRTVTALGLVLSGEVPLPSIFLSRRSACDPERWSVMAAAKYAGAHLFELDRLASFGDDSVRYWADQLGELIEFAERTVRGIRYSEDKLIELLEMDQQALDYLRDTYELRKRIPCPISPQDSFRLSSRPSRFSNPGRYLEYCRSYRDELFERADKGIAGVPEEKLRIAWLASAPFGKDVFDLLSRKGVSLPWFHHGSAPFFFGVVRNDYSDDRVYGRKLTPLEEVARYLNANAWGGTADLWVDSLIQVCRDLRIDAVVDFLQVGCITTKNIKKITSERLVQELGIPTLDIAGREFFMSEGEEARLSRILDDFLDMCIANKAR